MDFISNLNNPRESTVAELFSFNPKRPQLPKAQMRKTRGREALSVVKTAPFIIVFHIFIFISTTLLLLLNPR